MKDKRYQIIFFFRTVFNSPLIQRDITKPQNTLIFRDGEAAINNHNKTFTQNSPIPIQSKSVLKTSRNLPKLNKRFRSWNRSELIEEKPSSRWDLVVIIKS